MNKSKRIMLIILLTLCLYYTLGFIEKKLLTRNEKRIEITVLSQDVKKGDKIDSKVIKKINTITKSDKPIVNNLVENSYAKQDLKKGQILYNELVTSKDKVVKASSTKEVVSIPLKNAQDSVSYRVSKDSIVNVYFSSKTKYLDGILHNKDMISSNQAEGFSTIMFLKNAKIIDVINKEGISKTNEENFVIDTILIEVDKIDAKLIKNLKNVGDFSLTMEV